MMGAAELVVHRGVGPFVVWIARASRHWAAVVYFLSILINLTHQTLPHRSWRIVVGLRSLVIKLALPFHHHRLTILQMLA